MTNEIIVELESFLADAKRIGVVSSLEMQARYIHLHLHILGHEVECSTCPAKIERAINKFYEQLNKFKTMSEEQSTTPKNKHVAKRDQIIYLPSKHKHLRTTLMTDEEIIALIAYNEGYAPTFELAEGWEKEVEEYLENLPEEVTEKQEVKLTALQLASVQTKEELISKLATANKKYLNRIAKQLDIADYVMMSIEQIRIEIAETVA